MTPLAVAPWAGPAAGPSLDSSLGVMGDIAVRLSLTCSTTADGMHGLEHGDLDMDEYLLAGIMVLSIPV